MIAIGLLPNWGAQGGPTVVNADSLKFLNFSPKDEKPTRVNLLKACRHLHLAFTTGVSGGHLQVEEIYGILVSLLIRVAHDYDPHYHRKVKEIVTVIHEQLKNVIQFGAAEINCHLDFDCDRHCRMLCRHQFLVEVGKGLERPRHQTNRPPPNK